MKYYRIIFSDFSETVGKQTSRTAMERGARKYCKMWNLSETVREVIEITPEEYSSRTGEPIAEEKKPKKKNNTIPRTFYRITARQLTESSGGKPGDVWHVFRNDNGLLGLNTATGKYFYIFASHLRNPDLFEFLKVEKPEKDPEPNTPEETTTAPTEGQEEQQIGTTSPATVSDGEEYPTEQPTPEDVKTLLQLFRAFYNDLYEKEEDPDPATRAAADAIGREYCQLFDEYIKSRPAILAAFTEARRDYITSDREAAAYMLALEALQKAEQDATETLTEAPTTDGTTAADTETTSTANEPQSATETPTETTTDTTTRPESMTEGTTDTTPPATDHQKQDAATDNQRQTPGNAASTPGQSTSTPGTAGRNTDQATLSDRPTDQQTTHGTTTSSAATRGSPTRPQTAPQRAAKSRAAPTTTNRAKAPTRAKYKVIQAIPQTDVPGNATFSRSA